jgi:hypothetical protein
MYVASVFEVIEVNSQAKLSELESLGMKVYSSTNSSLVLVEIDSALVDLSWLCLAQFFDNLIDLVAC